MNVSLLATPSGPCFLVNCQDRYGPLMRQIPGARYVRGDDGWRMPATRASSAALGGIFGRGRLEISDGALAKLQQLAQTGATLQGIKDGSGTLNVHDERLFDHQDTAVDFLTLAGSALLADEMGLGKTVESLVAVDEIDGFPLLIVCTNSMKYKWKEECGVWLDDRKVIVVEGSAAKRRKLLDEQADVYVINYESLRLHSQLAAFGSLVKEGAPAELNRPWGTVIADEVHKAKSPKAKQTRALWRIAETAKHRFGLTGTPIVNDPDDLWSVMHFVCAEEWPARARFRDRYCVTNIGWHGGLENIGLNPTTEREMRKFLDPRYLRRTKEVVGLKDHPVDIRRIPLSTKQERSYNQMRKHMMTEIDGQMLIASEPIVVSGRLRQMASATPVLDDEGNVVELAMPSNKVTALLDILEEHQGQMVVYAESRKLIELAAREVEAAGFTVGMVTGGQSPEMRALTIERFQAKDIDVVLGTTGAGAEGITLTAAACMVFLQESYSNVANKQSKARINRIGQAVTELQYIVLISDGTIDEAVHAVCHEKEGKLQQLVRDPQWLEAAARGEC